MSLNAECIFWPSSASTLTAFTSGVSMQETDQWLVSVALHLSDDKEWGERRRTVTIRRGETRGGRNLEDRQKTAGKRKGKTEGGRFSVNKLKTDVRYERQRAAPCLTERLDSVGGFWHLQRRWATCLEDQKTALHAALSQADWKAFIFI